MHITRRSFLGSAAAAAVAGARLRAASGMFVSLNGALTAGKNVGWPDFARLAARTGYGGVDWPLAQAKTAGVEATRALFAELHLSPSIASLPVQPGRGDDPSFQATLRSLDEDARFCQDVGCSRMMTVLPPAAPAPKAEYRPMYRDRLAAIAEVLRRSSIQLGIEFLGPLQFRTRPSTYEFIWRMDDAVAFARECGPNVGVVLDAWHWHHAGATAQDILSTGKARIVHVHVSDARQQKPEDVRDNDRLMPGEGVIDLVGFFTALKTLGYEGGVSPEPLGRIPPEMSADDAAMLGLTTTRAVMAKAGISV
jgi:sugar phosphate isomerase/epimerase